MYEVAQVRKGGQVRLPAAVRQALDVREGDFLALEVQGDQVVLRVQKTAGKVEPWPWDHLSPEREVAVPQVVGAGRVRGCGIGEGAKPCPTVRGGRHPPFKEIGL